MNWSMRVVMVMVSLAFFGSLELTSGPAQVLASPVTDAFEMKATVKQWCRTNPKYFQNYKVDLVLAITRDSGSSDVQAIVGGAPLTFTGRMFWANKSHSAAEFALSGAAPGSGQFLTFRGRATFDRFGNLSKMTGTFVGQGQGTTNGGPLEDCLISSATFRTGKKIVL